MGSSYSDSDVKIIFLNENQRKFGFYGIILSLKNKQSYLRIFMLSRSKTKGYGNICKKTHRVNLWKRFSKSHDETDVGYISKVLQGSSFLLFLNVNLFVVNVFSIKRVNT